MHPLTASILTPVLILPLIATSDECCWEYTSDGISTSCPVGIQASAPVVGLHVSGPWGSGILSCSGTIRGDAVGSGYNEAVHGRADRTGVLGEVYSGIEYGKGVHGVTNSPNGSGVRGTFNGLDGAGVSGWALESEDGEVYGVDGMVFSGKGAGVRGYNFGERGSAIGVLGESFFGTGVQGIGYAETGSGVHGRLTHPDAAGAAVYGETHSERGQGVWGAGPANGVWGYAYTAGGVGVYGLNNYAERGETIGVKGETTGAEGIGVSGIATSSKGATIGVRGETTSRQGYAGYFIGRGFFSDAVGVGTLQPQYQLHVNGDAGKPGGGSWSNASDIRLKTNVQPITGALDQMLAINGVTFEYLDPVTIHELPGQQIGVIAQEVEAVFPQWVDDGADGFKRVTYRGFEAMTIEAMRELRTDNEQLQAALAQRDEQIASLESRLARLEAMLLKQP